MINLWLNCSIPKECISRNWNFRFFNTLITIMVVATMELLLLLWLFNLCCAGVDLRYQRETMKPRRLVPTTIWNRLHDWIWIISWIISGKVQSSSWPKCKRMSLLPDIWSKSKRTSLLSDKIDILKSGACWFCFIVGNIRRGCY